MATPGAELRPKADYFQQDNPQADNFQADKAEHRETFMDLQSAAAWAAMHLNRPRRVELMELEAELSAAETERLEPEAGHLQEAVEKSAAETERLDTEMDRLDAEEPARDLIRAT